MKKFFAAVLLVATFTPMIVLAAGPVTNPCTIQSNAGSGTSTPPSALPACINQVYVWSLGVGALLAFMMIIIGGYYYMTASGNAERSSRGTEIIWSSIIGLVLLFGAYLLLNTINPNLVNFSSFTNDFNNLNTTVNCTSVPRGTPGCP